MTTINRVCYQSIILFEDSSDKIFKNYLKEFMYFLKYSGKKNLIDFSYSSSEASTHKNLTIKENIILDALPTSLNKDNDDSFNELLLNIENKSLAKLIAQLGPLDEKISNLSSQNEKMASIAKCILSKTEYIFLIEPEEHLNSKQVSLIKSVLAYEVEHNNRIVFIKAKNNDLWLDLVTNIVSRDHNNHYVSTANPLLKLKRQKNFKSTYDFTLIKNAA